MTSGSTSQPRKNNPSAAEVQYLRTDHLLHDIGRRAVSGGFVTVAAQAAKFVLTLAGAAILARLLTPKEFGLVGMVLGVTSLVAIFNELGLSTATVQRKNITQQQVSNLFWVNLAVSGVVTAVSCGLAPLIADFYHDPRVKPIMFALSLMFLLSGSTVQHRAVLTRQMRFRSIAAIDVASMFAGFATACILADFGFSYWALVAQQLTYALACLLLTWNISRWRPSWPRTRSGVRPLLSFGAHLTVADFVARLSATSDTVLIGKFFGAAQLGLYTRASVLMSRPMQQVLTPITAVMDPVLARLQSDPERYRRSFLRTFDALAMLVLPISALCFALAKPIVLVVLGPRWTGAIPLLSLFAAVAISSPLAAPVSWLYQSQGRGRDQLINHTSDGLITVAAYVVGLPWGPRGVILSLAIASALICLPVVYRIAGRSGPVSTSDLWRAYLSQLPVWGTVYLATQLALSALPHSLPIVQLLICAPVGLLLGSAALMPFRHFRESALFAFTSVRKAVMQKFGTA